MEIVQNKENEQWEVYSSSDENATKLVTCSHKTKALYFVYLLNGGTLTYDQFYDILYNLKIK